MEYTYQNSHVLTCLSKCVFITWAKTENDVTLQTTDFASTEDNFILQLQTERWWCH
jgi:hypothetical protein